MDLFYRPYPIKFGSKDLQPYGGNYNVPTPVIRALLAIKAFLIQNEQGVLSSTGIYVGNDIFITNSHSIDPIGGNESYHVGLKNNDNYYADDVEIISDDPSVDLALVKRISKPNVHSFYSSSELLRFSQNDPRPGDTLYLIGYHSDKGLSIIPVDVQNKTFSSKDSIWSEKGKQGGYFFIFSTEFTNDDFCPLSLSGGALVNPKGELVGIFKGAGKNLADNYTGDGIALDRLTIKEFLQKNKMAYG